MAVRVLVRVAYESDGKDNCESGGKSGCESDGKSDYESDGEGW